MWPGAVSGAGFGQLVSARAILVGLAAIRFGVSRFLSRSLARLLPGSDLLADRAAALGIMHGAE